MPTVFQNGPYYFRFYSADNVEPPHIHVHRDRNGAKFWLDPIPVLRNWGFPAPELRRVRRIIEEHQTELLEAWDDYSAA